jgi:hypothetical protein
LRHRHQLIVCGIVCAVLATTGVAVAAGRVLPFMGREPAPSIFGVNTGTYDSSHTNFLKDMPTARRMGARWVHFTGESIHFGRGGQPNYGTLDYEVTRAKQLGLGVLISLGGTPRACSVRPVNQSYCPPTTARDFRIYETFLRAELVRYRNVVDDWESWLEPNGRSWWPPRPNPQQYANLLVAQYQVFSAVNREYHVHLKLLFAGPSDFSIIPGSPGKMPVLPFVHQVLADLRGRHVFDAIALHAYRFPPTAPWVRDYDSVQGIPAAAGSRGPYPDDGCASSPWCQMTWPQELSAYEQEFANDGYGAMPLWLTEFGWPGNARANGSYFPSYAAQAANLSAAYHDLLGLRFVKAAFWFNLRDYQPRLRNPDPSFFAHYGLLEYHFAPKPAATEFERLASANRGR